MSWRFFIPVLLAFAAISCSTPAHQKKPKRTENENMQKAAGDVSFQAFVGQLRSAVAAHDAATIASMMTPNFGYRLDPPGEGDGVFQYWDDKGLWQELRLVLGEKFVPHGNFMVSPTQFATDPDYHGYRAGITMISGSWKFAYFVND